MSDTIKKNVRDMADLLKGEMKVGEHGVIEVTAEAFEKSLSGTELSPETYKAVQAHNATLIAAVGLACGEIAIPAMKKDKKLDQVSVELPILKDSVGASFLRSKEFPNAQGGDPILKYGVLTSKFVVDANGNKGDYKKVRTHLSELAAAALK